MAGGWALHLALLGPSGPFFLPSQLIDGRLILRFDTVAGLTYELQYQDALGIPDWYPLLTITGDGNVKKISVSAGLSQQRFYRLLVSSQ